MKIFAQILASVSLFLVACSVSYYFVIFLPQAKRTELELIQEQQAADEQAKIDAEQALSSCLSEAETARQSEYDGIEYALQESGCVDAYGTLAPNMNCVNWFSDNKDEADASYEGDVNSCYDKFQ